MISAGGVDENSNIDMSPVLQVLARRERNSAGHPVRAIIIEKLAREHCAVGGIDDVGTARKHAADNYDASKDRSDEMLASYWSTLLLPGLELS